MEFDTRLDAVNPEGAARAWMKQTQNPEECSAAG
jgi:hypothetical protein